MQDWLKLHTDLLDNPDVALMSAEDFQFATFMWMLCRKEGFTDGRMIGWDYNRLAYRFRMSVADVTRSVTLLSRADIHWLCTDENGVICITHYAERQYGKPSASPAAAKERKRRQRMRERGIEPEVSASRHTPVTPIEEKRLEETREDKKHTGAGAPGQSPVKSSKSSETEPIEYHAVTKELEVEFARLTGLPLPPRETKKQQQEAGKLWWNPLMAIWKIAGEDTVKAKSLMHDTVAHMSSEKLTFDAPISIVRVCRSQSKTVQVAGPPALRRNNRQSSDADDLAAMRAAREKRNGRAGNA